MGKSRSVHKDIAQECGVKVQMLEVLAQLRDGTFEMQGAGVTSHLGARKPQRKPERHPLSQPIHAPWLESKRSVRPRMQKISKACAKCVISLLSVEICYSIPRARKRV
eukprot:794463-Pyramimonas_sp.AAC.1